MRIIGIGGKARAGKDTIAEYFMRKHGALRAGFSDALKDVAHDQFGWDGVKDAKGRRLLQVLGTEAGREYNQDLWVNKFHKRHCNESRLLIVPDTRFRNELSYVEQQGGLSIWVSRPETEESLQGEAAAHISENELGKHDFFFNVVNDGTLEELYAKLDDIVGYFHDHPVFKPGK